MAKVKLPKWLSEVYGKVSRTSIAFRRFRNTIVLEADPSPSYTRSQAQASQRDRYKQAIQEWRTLDNATKEYYRELGRRYNLPAYHMFMKEKLKAPPTAQFLYSITIDNSQNANTLTDYQILLNIQNDAQFFQDIPDPSKMEFYDEDQTTLLNHYVELWDNANYNAKIWIKIPTIPGGQSKTIYLKYNPDRTQDISDPYNVFEYFEDWETGQIDPNKYTIIRGTPEATQLNPYEGLYSWEDDYQSDTRTNIVFQNDIRIICYAQAVHRNFILKFHFQDLDNNYHIFYRVITPIIEIRKRVNATNYTLATQSYSSLPTSYVRLEIYRFSNSIRVIVIDPSTNNILFDNTVSDSTFKSGYLCYGCFNLTGEIARYDYTYITKYTEPEPTVSYSKL